MQLDDARGSVGSSRQADQASRERQVKLSRQAGGAVGLLSEVARLCRTGKRTALEAQRSILELLERELDLRRSALGVLGSTGRVLSIACSRDLNADELARLRYAAADGVLGRVLRAVAPMTLANDATDGPSQGDGPAASPGRVFVAVPVCTADGVLGTLSGELPAPSERSVQVLALVASLLAPLMAAEPAGERDVDASGSDFVATPGLREVLRLAERVAPTAAHVLLRGESGVGKECIVRALWQARRPTREPLLCVRCTSLHSESLEAEIRGQLARVFAAGSRFTLFVDEVSELSPSDQAQLLRILDAGYRGAAPRLLATTREDLRQAARSGSFRSDLFFRLHVFPLDVPPLRERRDDIAPLAQHFLRKYATQHDKRVTRISDCALQLLGAYAFPGNVRELDNCISRAVLLAQYGVIRQHHLPRSMQPATLEPRGPRSLLAQLQEHERALVQAELERTRNDRVEAAHALGTTPRILAYRLKKLGLATHERATGARS